MLGYNELLSEKCSYEKFKKNNKYNEKEYHPQVSLDCFISFDFSNERGFDQQTLNVNKKIFIKNEFEPNEFDKVDSKEIKTIKPVKGLKVPIIGWEIWV